MPPKFARSASRQDLLHLYRRLLKACKTYPSRNKDRIYAAIREDFKEHRNLDPKSDKAMKQIYLAYQGIDQLKQFDGRHSANFSLTLEQDPFPKPDDR